jgi:hypothetical protein
MEPMNQPPRPEPCDPVGVSHGIDREQPFESAAVWQSLRPEILDRVLDPEAT